MRDKSTNIKRQILSYISKLDKAEYDLYSDITLRELQSQFISDIKKVDEKEAKADEKLKNEFKDVYIKKYSDDSPFGKELEVFHIKSIEFETYCTDYKKHYKINGTRISFNGINGNVRELSSNAHDLMSAKELRACTVINRKDYDLYLETLLLLQKKFNEIVTE